MPVVITSTVKNEVYERLKRYRQNIAKTAAIMVRDELYEFALSAIASFYMGYDPEYYRRTYNLMNSVQKYYRNPHGSWYRGGITIGAGAMDEYRYGTFSKGDVFDYTIGQGAHGYPGQTVDTSPSPLEIIQNKYREILNNKESYIAAAKATVRF